MDEQETITVITGDCEYQIKANNWIVSGEKYLNVHDGTRLVAQFSPGCWICVMKTEANVSEGDAK